VGSPYRELRRQSRVDAGKIPSTVLGSAEDDCWEATDRHVIRLADQLHDTSHATEAFWKEISAHFAEDQRVELVALAGLYHGVSYMVNALGVQHKQFAPRFPGATDANLLAPVPERE
jgi:4-carboxymuconolactone decarboxylase